MSLSGPCVFSVHIHQLMLSAITYHYANSCIDSDLSAITPECSLLEFSLPIAFRNLVSSSTHAPHCVCLFILVLGLELRCSHGLGNPLTLNYMPSDVFFMFYSLLIFYPQYSFKIKYLASFYY